MPSINSPNLRLAFKIARAFGKHIEEMFLYGETEEQDKPSAENYDTFMTLAELR
jgi:DNA-binding XRE family transcriptional regulator